MEGTSATELAAAIALVPAGLVLVDFAADADVYLVFGPPTPHGYPPAPWEDGWENAA